MQTGGKENIGGREKKKWVDIKGITKKVDEAVRMKKQLNVREDE